MARNRSGTDGGGLIAVYLLGSVPFCLWGLPHTNGNGGDGGFLDGFIHGLYWWISLLVSLFKSDVNVYQWPNSHNFYNFGFFFGVIICIAVFADDPKNKR